MNIQATNLTDHFLIAMPGLADPNFFKTVTYICSHDETGAMGIVINRPLNIQLDEVLSQMEIESNKDEVLNHNIYYGGPVHEDRGFILHSDPNNWDSSLHIAEGINVTTSMDILESIAEGKGPDDLLVALGYAGWSAGQLEDEIMDNVWLSGPSHSDVIFKTPVEDRWETSAALLGVDLTHISSDVGHA
jgi:putative transcriptional regulator